MDETHRDGPQGDPKQTIDMATAFSVPNRHRCAIAHDGERRRSRFEGRHGIGTVLALVCTVMAVLPKVGVNALPSVVTDNARWGNMLAGVVIVLAVLLWRGALPDDPDSVMGASLGVYIAVVAGIMAIAIDGRSGPTAFSVKNVHPLRAGSS